MTKGIGGVSVDVVRIEPDDPVYTGIRWRLLARGLVPVYEEHTARLERGFSMTDWYNLPEFERALVIAVRRIENSSQSIQSEAEAKAAERRSKRRK